MPEADEAIRLTPPPDSMHIPSGPRDLKEYDTPAYLRRGIELPQIDEASEAEDLVPAEQHTEQRSAAAQRGSSAVIRV